MRFLRFSIPLVILSLSEVLAACPTCSSAVVAGAGGPAQWIVSGAFLLFPLLLVSGAALLIRGILADGEIQKETNTSC